MNGASSAAAEKSVAPKKSLYRPKPIKAPIRATRSGSRTPLHERNPYHRIAAIVIMNAAKARPTKRKPTLLTHPIKTGVPAARMVMPGR